MSEVWILEKFAVWPESLACQLIQDYPIRILPGCDALAMASAMALPAHGKTALLLIHGPSLELSANTALMQAGGLCQGWTGPCLLVKQEASGEGLVVVDMRAQQELGPAAGLPLLVAEALRKGKHLLKAEAGHLCYRHLAFDTAGLQLRVMPDGVWEALPLKEARLLKVFMERPDTCLPRSEIKERVWGGVHVSPRTIDSQISRLRKRLAYCGVTIENVYGDGYIFT